MLELVIVIEILFELVSDLVLSSELMLLIELVLVI